MTRLFVSDVHLDAGAPEAVEQFLDFLRAHAADAEALYVLGDLFEAWVGDDDPDPAKARVCEGLRGLTKGGTGCFVLHGNRDFLIGRDFCRNTGCRLLADPVVVELDGERVLLTHGDALCTAEWQRRFLSLPLAYRELLANKARAGSREHTSRTIPNIMDVNEDAVCTAYRATRVRRIIHGHTHRPAVHDTDIEGEPAQRIVLGAWYEQGSYLAYENGRYDLRSLPRAARPQARGNLTVASSPPTGRFLRTNEPPWA
jgi:UDP-2,3-diacylglucosamine hydrolase